jgi:enamine deaminase RidA (YjgF/YER057c/UK114 family)
VLVRGDRAIIAGHGPLAPDGTVAGPFGKVGGELTLEQGQEAARLVALAMIADLKRALGDLDRVETWLRVFGMVNSAPGFVQQPAVMNGFSELIVDVFGEAGRHTRSAVGMAELPFNIPVEIEGEVAIRA